MLIEAFAAGAGATAALLLVGGTIALRWQRNAQHYELAKAALDQGLAPPVEPLPAWLLSSRAGAMRVAVGLGLLVAGGVAWLDGAHVPPPRPGPGMSAAMEMMHDHPHGQPPGPDHAPPPPAPEADHPPGPDAPPPGETRPLPPERLPPPPPDPEAVRWLHAQAQMHIGLLAVAAGLIVALTGWVRVLFARLERRHALATATPLVPPAPTASPAPPTP